MMHTVCHDPWTVEIGEILYAVYSNFCVPPDAAVQRNKVIRRCFKSVLS